MDGGVLRKRGADVLEFGFLLIAREGDARSLPGGDALLQAPCCRASGTSQAHAPSSRSCSGVGMSLYLYVLRTVCCSIALYSA